MKMKRILLALVAALAITACITPEERAARQAENLKMVKASVAGQKYKITVNEMTPMRGSSMTVTGGRYLKVDSTLLECSLPYLGRDDIPQLTSHAQRRQDANIEFKSEVRQYLVQYRPKEKSAVITFKATYGVDEYTFTIKVDDAGRARIHLVPKDRDYIDYEGNVVAL